MAIINDIFIDSIGCANSVTESEYEVGEQSSISSCVISIHYAQILLSNVWILL